MDPNEALRLARERREEMRTAGADYDAGRITGEEYDDIMGEALRAQSEAYEGLDDWVSKGGFLPTEWARGR
jgi:hypothetical protein